MPGIAISPVEIVQVSGFGVWLAVEDEEDDYPLVAKSESGT